MLPLILIFAMFQAVGPKAQSNIGLRRDSPCATGACTETWTGPGSQPITTHNGRYVAVSGGVGPAGMVLLGSSLAGPSSFPFTTYGFIFSGNTSDTMQLIAPATTSGGVNKFACVGMTQNVTTGYCVALGFGHYDRLLIFKNGSLLAQSPVGPYNGSISNTIKIVRDCTSGVQLRGSINGTQVVTFTDTSSPIGCGSGNIGAYGGGSGTLSDSNMGAWQDH